MATRMNLGKWRRRKPDPGSIEMPCRCGEGMKPNTLHSLAWCALLAGGPRRRSNAGSPRRLHHCLRYGGRCWDRECDPGDEKRTDGVSRGAVLGVIDAERQKLRQLVRTLNVPAAIAPDTRPHPAGTTHSVAANARNNHVFVPLAANNAFPTTTSPSAVVGLVNR